MVTEKLVSSIENSSPAGDWEPPRASTAVNSSNYLSQSAPAAQASTVTPEKSPPKEQHRLVAQDRDVTTTSITVGKFKDKRPEPLKLNPNLNQDIPLDLSVKR